MAMHRADTPLRCPPLKVGARYKNFPKDTIFRREQSTSLAKHSERRIFMSVTVDDSLASWWPLKRTPPNDSKRNGDFPATNVEPVPVVFLGGLLSRKHIRGMVRARIFITFGGPGARRRRRRGRCSPGDAPRQLVTAARFTHYKFSKSSTERVPPSR